MKFITKLNYPSPSILAVECMVNIKHFNQQNNKDHLQNLKIICQDLISWAGDVALYI